MRTLLFVGVLFIFGCTSKRTSNKPLIVCSTSIIADCTRQIVSDSFEVVSLMGPEIDPHSYNPRPSDAKSLEQANIIIYNGLHLEGKMAELYKHLSQRKKVIRVSAYIPESQTIKVDNQGTIDPHIWFDTPNWIKAFQGVTNELSEAYPSQKENFQKNYDGYKAEIMSQFKVLKLKLSQIPYEQRVIITSHDAFHYFARAYDCQVKAIQGTSTTQEPSISAMQKLETYILEHKIKALFVESSVNPKSIASLIENCKLKGHEIKIGGTLYSDALGAKKAKSYSDMLTENCNTIFNALNP